MGVMPAAQNPTPSERPVIAFFDVDNTLMHGTSVFHVGREAWARGIIGWRDILLFGWHQRRFIKVGENHGAGLSGADLCSGAASDAGASCTNGVLEGTNMKGDGTAANETDVTLSPIFPTGTQGRIIWTCTPSVGSAGSFTLSSANTPKDCPAP